MQNGQDERDHLIKTLLDRSFERNYTSFRLMSSYGFLICMTGLRYSEKISLLVTTETDLLMRKHKDLQIKLLIGNNY